MLKKRITALVMSCVLVCILPIMSYSMDKDEFLKFLVNSSYPESKDNTENVENVDDKDKAKKEENTDTEEYVKFHIGEENIPSVNKTEEKEVSTNKKEVSTNENDVEYKDNIKVTKENPRILLYHSHAGETYSNAPDGNFHSQDKPNSVMAVGSLVTEELSKKGWGVLHSTKYHDYPSFNESYMSSRKTLDALMPKYPSIDIAIDLHRDGRTLTQKEAQKVGTTLETLKNKEHNRMSTTYKGEPVAKFFFVVGMKNQNAGQVQSLAEDITSFAMKKYPELILPVVKKPYGKFNQSVAKNHMLIEVGSNGTTSEEAKNSAKYVAQILDEYFKTK